MRRRCAHDARPRNEQAQLPTTIIIKLSGLRKRAGERFDLEGVKGAGRGGIWDGKVVGKEGGGGGGSCDDEGAQGGRGKRVDSSAKEEVAHHDSQSTADP